MLDITGRLLPVGWLHVLPEHIATRRPGRYAPFIPNLSLVEDPWVGETAMTGNLPPVEVRPPVRFSTDAWGYRMTPGTAPGGQVDVLLHGGASFAYGGGLSDDETLPAVMTRTTGLKVYNGGHFYWDNPSLEPLDDLVSKMNGQKPVVVLLEWEQLEHDLADIQGRPWKTDGIGRRLLGVERYTRLRGDVQFARRYFNAVLNISPVEVLSIRLFKRLSNDQLLPNRYQEAVLTRLTPDGKRMLFLRDEVKHTQVPPTAAAVEARAIFFETYRKMLAERGLDLVVVLLPNKYTIYGGLVDHAGDVGEPYLNRLERGLTQHGVRTLNMLPVFRAEVPGDLATGEFSYYRDDHHWSPKGVRITAEKLGRYLQSGRK